MGVCVCEREIESERERTRAQRKAFRPSLFSSVSFQPKLEITISTYEKAVDVRLARFRETENSFFSYKTGRPTLTMKRVSTDAHVSTRTQSEKPYYFYIGIESERRDFWPIGQLVVSHSDPFVVVPTPTIWGQFDK